MSKMLLDDRQNPIKDEETFQEWIRYSKTVIVMFENYSKLALIKFGRFRPVN